MLSTSTISPELLQALLDNPYEGMVIFDANGIIRHFSRVNEVIYAIPDAQSHILFEIRRRGSPSMQQVAEELGMDVTTFSRQAKSLEGKGLIVRQLSPDDRRVNLSGETREGMRMLEQIDRYMAEKLERIFSATTPFEQEAVVRPLALLKEVLPKSNCHTPQNK